jgi:hypothetical protein
VTTEVHRDGDITRVEMNISGIDGPLEFFTSPDLCQAFMAKARAHDARIKNELS